MSRNKSFSSLSLAALIMLAAAGSSLAQNQSGARNHVAAPGSGLALVLTPPSRASEVNNRFMLVESKDVVKTSHLNPLPKLSQTSFNATRQDGFVKGQRSFDHQSIRFDFPSFDSRKQFRTDDETGSEQAKRRLTFVPSRGQKIPG